MLILAATLTVEPQPTALRTGEEILRIHITGAVDAPLRLRFSPYVDRVEARIPLANGAVADEIAGMSIPFAQRSIRTVTPMLPLPRNMRMPASITLRVHAEDLRFAAPTLETNYPSNPPDEPFTFYVLTAGLLLGIALYHAMLFFALRDWDVARYVFYLVVFIVYEMVASGLAWQVLWPHASIPAIEALRVAALGLALGVYTFATSFMQTKSNAPFMHRLFTIAIWFTAAATLAGLVFPSTLAISAIVGDLGLLFGILTATATAIVCVRRGVRSARFFLIGFMGLFVGGIIKIVGDDIGSITSTAHFYGVELGVSFDAVILALGLADRIRGEIRERERVQALAAEHERNAFTDALTGVPNRRFFDERLRAEWHRACRHGGCVSLIMIDIDRFKPYNDTAGHREGDDCLRLIAQTMHGLIRRADELFARYGGEEFAVILPGTSLEEAMSLAQRLAGAVRDLQIEHPTGGVVTVSVGVASHPALQPAGVERLVEDADGALYRAKHSGGDRAAVSA